MLRHRTRDIEIFDEIFVGDPTYAPPARLHALLRSKPLRVLDLGANIGLFGAFALGAFDVASLTTFEPDPSNLPILHHCRVLNPGPPWKVVEACAAPEDGRASFSAGKYADSHVSFGTTTGDITVPAIDVFPYMAEADLIKIDIEGSEWDILADPRLAGIGETVIVLEWHRLGSPTPHPFASATQLLQDAGFSVAGVDHGYPHGTLWAWNFPAVSVPA